MSAPPRSRTAASAVAGARVVGEDQALLGSILHRSALLETVLSDDRLASPSAIGLGAFELHGRIGRGGMGVVWGGAHRRQGVPVAVKVLASRAGDPRAFLAGFRNEVRAVARLDHPNIVRVLDHGLVTAEESRDSGSLLPVGCPWLAMERADGTLSALRGRLTWPELRDVLLRLLDALAHAHARGVIHRDLKPGNVLIGGTRPGLKLTDFGLASLAHDDEADAWSSAGTPSYMSPEQIEGRARDQGPWTDLYQLGCVAWALASGRPPFRLSGFQAIRHAHLERTPPPLRAVHPVPAGFEGWLRRMIAKDPLRRFPRAADAAYALPRGPLAATPATAPGAGEATETAIRLPTSVAEATTIALPDEPVTLILPTWHPAKTTGGHRAGHASAPPVPETWHRREAPPIDMRLIGAGLGLYGLREIRLVGREPMRDAMWRALGDAASTRSPRAVVLVGPAGCGKSRLAGWLCRRAHEVGAATPLRAVHSPAAGPADGLGPMVSRHLRCTGLEQAAARARTLAWLASWGDDAQDVDALTEIIAPSAGTARVQFGSPEERWVLLTRALRRLGSDRPVAVWLDDVQWGPDALGFARHLLDAAALPALVICTVREEALAELPEAARAIEDLLQTPGASRLTVSALPPAHHAALVRDLLGFDSALAARVEERTAGNPLFAVQLVGDWVARGLLVPGARGFELAPGARIELPDDLHAVWAARVDRMLNGLPDGARDALELAAALGQDVDRDEWEALCARPEVVAALEEELLAARLAHPTASGWAFVHGMLRESLGRMATARGTAAAHHARCLDILGARGVDPGRLGLHAFGAEQWATAAALIDEGATRMLGSGELRAAFRLAARYREALERDGAAQTDRRWVQLALLRASLLAFSGSLSEAEAITRDAMATAAAHGWRDEEVSCLLHLARHASYRRDLPRADALSRRALERLGDADDPLARAQALQTLAAPLWMRGALDEALRVMAQARASYESVGDALSAATCLANASEMYLMRGDLDDAAAQAEEALEIYTRLRAPARASGVTFNLARVQRARGDLSAAEAGYDAAIAVANRWGSSNEVIYRVHRLHLYIEQGRVDEALEGMDTLRQQLRDRDDHRLLPYLDAHLLPCLSLRRAWRRFDTHLAAATAWFDDTGIIDDNVAWSALHAARSALAAGETSRAAAAAAMASTQLRALGQGPEADALERAVEDAGG